MKVVFCIYGYNPQVERLQPWLTVHEVSAVMIASGWEVHLITDVEEKPTLANLHHHYIPTMRPSGAEEMRILLDVIVPDRVIVLSTPLNLISSSWYRFVCCDLVAFLSYPFYTYPELGRALPHLSCEDVITYGRHAAVPKCLWAATLRKYYSAVIAQSSRTARRVASAAGPGMKAYGLQAGLDLSFWTPREGALEDSRSVIRYIYVGSAKAIRGFDVLLNSFRRLEGHDVELRVLARGSTSEEVEQLRRRIDKHVGPMRDRVEIIGGWMEREQYRDELRDADVVVLPFVLVPSELPVSVIECIACGTPVVTTDIDGLPDAVGNAGVIVRSGSVSALAKAMAELADSPGRLGVLRECCIEARKEMMTWPDVGQEWLKVLSS